MNAIYKKEINQYFNSIMGYVFLSMFLLISGYFFSTYNLLAANGNISSFFSGMISLLMYLIPMLTMRSFAEEKKIKTEQLLYTAPVSTTSIVMGKFLAAMTVFSIGIMVTFTYPIIIAMNGKIDILVTLGNYLGTFLLVGAFIAIGIFISSITDSQVVAAVLSYCVLFALWFVSYIASFVNNQGIIAFVKGISVLEKYYEFSMGIFNPSSVLFYLSLIFVFLFSTVRVLEGRRWN